MSLFDDDDTCEIEARGSIRDADVVRLRQVLLAGADMSAGEADALWRLQRNCPVKDVSWPEFFIEAITDYIVAQREPTGYLTSAKAQWLIARLAPGGRPAGCTELELLVNVIEKARWCPASLAAFAMSEVAASVATGHGVLRVEPAEAGTITAPELHYLRRILFAFGRGSNCPVTQAECAVLIEIAGTLKRDRIPSAFIDLYVKAIANATLASLGYAVPSREEALRIGDAVRSEGRRPTAEVVQAAFTRSPRVAGEARIVGSMLTATYRLQAPEERAVARLERQRVEIITNEAMPPTDARWLAERLGGRPLDPATRELLIVLSRDCPRVEPPLATLVEAACAA